MVQENEEFKEELEKQRREYCEENPEDVSDKCKDIRKEEEDRKKAAEAAVMTFTTIGILSCLCFVLLFAFMMMKKQGKI